MKSIQRVFTILREEEGATAVEYAVMLALILLSVIASINAVGGATGDMWNTNVSQMRSVGFMP